jgi:hypothetical protein
MAQQPSEPEESDLKGDLEQMQLAEVIQTLGMNQKSGGLKIVNSSKKLGKIYFENGNITQASLEDYKAEEALYRILIWEEGFFEFDSKDKPNEAAITTGTTSLLMEGFNQQEEYLKYKKAMPPFENILKVAKTAETTGLKPTTQKIFDLIDGHRTIQDVIDSSPMNYLLTVKILYTFLKKEILESREQDVFQQPEDADYGQLASELYD